MEKYGPPDGELLELAAYGKRRARSIQQLSAWVLVDAEPFALPHSKRLKSSRIAKSKTGSLWPPTLAMQRPIAFGFQRLRTLGQGQALAGRVMILASRHSADVNPFFRPLHPEAGGLIG